METTIFYKFRIYKEEEPEFLFISSEQEITQNWVDVSIFLDAVKEYQVNAKEDLSEDNLKYLTAEYALGDLITFAREFQLSKRKEEDKKRTWNITTIETNTEWIIGGASYVTFIGTIVSSGPVEVKEDFFEYDEIVQKLLFINGGQVCLDYFLKNTETIDNILFNGSIEDKKVLKVTFGCSGLSDHRSADALTFIAGKFYQQCTESGFRQTAPKEGPTVRSPSSANTPGINKKYEERQSTKNSKFTNGELNSWTVLFVTSSNANIKAHIIKGGCSLLGF
ncbi:hypothetical protein K502DRAFT_347189 [Neoconidiobolus thromboides FSU 785]|nr:hypothetical protein K502DRAFT_347189 [Neoconidiobolus thromboides FSU 785]